VGAHARHVAPSKGKSAKQAARAKKPNKAAKSVKSRKKATSSRQGSKTAKFLDLLKRSGGATSADLMKATAGRLTRYGDLFRACWAGRWA
jgi:hypothetical protein